MSTGCWWRLWLRRLHFRKPGCQGLILGVENRQLDPAALVQGEPIATLAQTPAGKGRPQGMLGLPRGETCGDSREAKDCHTPSWPLGQGCEGLSEDGAGLVSEPHCPLVSLSEAQPSSPSCSIQSADYLLIPEMSTLTLPVAPSCCLHLLPSAP